MSGRALIAAALVLVLALAGCAQPGTPAPAGEAAKIDVATSRMSVACGYAAEMREFGGSHPSGIGWIESIAVSGAQKLAGVFRHDQTGIYQGESVGAVMGDSISLMGDCELPAARAVLEQAMHH